MGRPGDAYLRGYQYSFTEDCPIRIPKASNSKNRLSYLESLRNLCTPLQFANAATLAMRSTKESGPSWIVDDPHTIRGSRSSKFGGGIRRDQYNQLGICLIYKRGLLPCYAQV